MSKPIVYLAFANNMVNAAQFLAKLAEERANLRPLLQTNDRLQIETDPDATTDNLFNFFTAPDNRHRIQVFHYAGHGSPDGLHLVNTQTGDNQTAGAEGIAQIIASSQENMQLVFLNACSTEEQAQTLLAAGVKNVIGTSTSINDDVAVDFAMRFYQALINNQTINVAFKETEAYLKTILNSNKTEDFRGIIFKKDLAIVPPPNELPWKLYSRTPDDANWRLNEARLIQGSVKVFLAYAEEDVKIKDKLVRSLAVPIKRSKKIEAFDVLSVANASEENKDIIRKKLYEADLILLLVSDNFMVSDECADIEAIAMQRRAAGEARVIPIRLSPFEGYEELEFAKIAGLPNVPNKSKFISEWGSNELDTVLTHVAGGVVRVVNQMLNIV